MAFLLDIFNIFLRWFDIIPKLVYFVLVCFMSLVDIAQYVFRKLVGLDVYYLGEGNNPQTGDIALAFLRSIFEKDSQFPALKNAFWALVILGVILLVVSTIIAVIRQEYMPGQEETKAKDKNNKIFILTRSVKSLFLFLIVPVSAIFGLMLGDIFLQAFDKATTPSEASTLFSNATITDGLQSVEVNGVTSYSFYDIFGGALPTNSTSFSGIMFKVSAFTSNRIRLGESYSVNTDETDEFGFPVQEEKTFFELINKGHLSNFGIFNKATTDAEMAGMIDDAFANNIHFKQNTQHNIVLGPMRDQLESVDALVWGMEDGYNVTNFSKFNIPLIWYFYNLWFFNFIVGFAFFVVAAKLFADLIMGLAKRIIEIAALFIVSPPIIALMPLDDGATFKNWRKAFLGRAVSAYGVVLGFNIFFLLMPYLNMIRLFPPGNYGYEFINVIVETIFAVLGLNVIQGFMEMASKMIGGEDLAAAGGKMVAEVGNVMRKSAMFTAGAAGLAVTGVGIAGKAAGKVAGATLSVADKALLGGRGAKWSAKAKDDIKEEIANFNKFKNNVASKVGNAYSAVMGFGFGKKKTEQEAGNDWDRGGSDKAYDEKLTQDKDYQKQMDESYAKYQKNRGSKSKEDWQKSAAGKKARTKAESDYAKRTGEDREAFKFSGKEQYVKDKVNEARREMVTARGKKIRQGIVKNLGLNKLAVAGEVLRNEVKEAIIRGGKGAFPAMIAMFLGKKTASQIEFDATKKKIQKSQTVAAQIQNAQQSKSDEEQN